MLSNYASKAGRFKASAVTGPSFSDCVNTIKLQHDQFVKDPTSVDKEWIDYFTGDKMKILPVALTGDKLMGNIQNRPSTSDSNRFRNILPIILRSFQIRGHLVAKVDPLNLPMSAENHGQLWSREVNREWNPNEIAATLGLTEHDLKQPFDFDLEEINPHMTGLLSGSGNHLKNLEQFIERCDQVYCQSIGYEFTHIQDPKKLSWLSNRIERSTPCYDGLSKDEKKTLLRSVMETQGFEDILQKKFPTTKRFGLDGVEAMVPFLKEVVNEGQSDEFVLGMAHRGRLNVLSNVFHKPTVDLFREFKGVMGFGGSEYGKNGDVKYHLGVNLERPHEKEGAKRMQKFSLLCNPSHLETVDPIVLGQTRARQDRLIEEKSIDRTQAMKEVLPIMIHGDSALSGQGIIYEVAQMQNLPAYDVGGTIHVVSNNQIGFTTPPAQYLSSRYCTDVFRAFDSPIFHVNADDVEAVTFIAKLAIDYRNEFQTDVVVDIVGYRRNGHNEQDMPAFTNPQMYARIAQQPRPSDVYADRLINEGVVTKKEAEDLRKEVMDNYETALAEASKATTELVRDYTLTEPWQKMKESNVFSPPQETGLSLEKLRKIGSDLFQLPKGFTPHPTIKKIFDARVTSMKTGKGIDFGMAEALAFGSLLCEGKNVRIAGQDAQRGTFSHRHATVHDNVNFEALTPLKELVNGSAAFQVYNSHLSEYGALGFEVGYAIQHPDNLTIWEAQFGDFANGAQIMIDTVIAASEVKWGQQSPLVMYLPHGYDGMGPEHSSARIERFLALCDNREDLIDPVNFDPLKRRIVQTSNMQVIMPTTPANLYHALRRQMHRGFRKPLVVAQSKKLLKARVSQCDLADLGEDTMFQPFIGDVSKKSDRAGVERLILCAGQVYYDLEAERKKHGGVEKTKTAIARVEQLCPLPYDQMLAELAKYPNLKSVAWVQEEPMNAGMWTYMNPRIQTLLLYSNSVCVQPFYVGRDVCASTATGCPKIHAAESAKFLKEAFDLDQKHHSSKAFFNVGPDGVTMNDTVTNPAYYQHAGIAPK